MRRLSLKSHSSLGNESPHTWQVISSRAQPSLPLAVCQQIAIKTVAQQRDRVSEEDVVVVNWTHVHRLGITCLRYTQSSYRDTHLKLKPVAVIIKDCFLASITTPLKSQKDWNSMTRKASPVTFTHPEWCVMQKWLHRWFPLWQSRYNQWTLLEKRHTGRWSTPVASA